VHFRPLTLCTLVCLLASSVLAQTIASFDPPYGDPGATSVTISGSGFTGATSVTIGNVVCPSGTWQVSDQTGTQIVAYVPNTAVRGTVAPIIVKKGTSTATSGDSFRILPAGPFIASFSPTNAAVGSTVTFTGAHFNGATLTGVKFNGTSSPLVYTPTTDTELTCTVPSGGTTGFITVSATTGSYTTTNYFYYQPGVQSFSPSVGRPGTNVVIKGTNFLGVTKVSFGGVLATNFTTNSNTQITATVPVGATTGTLNVVAPAGQFISSSNFVVQPDITSISPIAGNVNTIVTINGVNLGGASPVVRFNGVLASILSGPTATQVTVVAPTGAGSGPITIQTADGTGTSPTNFFYPPSITSISPTNGAVGATITINGINLTNAQSVAFTGANATSYTVVNSNTVTALVPAGASFGPITVTTPYGPFTSAQNFFPAPIIGNFSPPSGVAGTPVTITGTNLSFTTAVLFNGTPATSLSNSTSTSIVAYVPSGASTGPITLKTYGGTAVSANNFLTDILTLSIATIDTNTIAISWTTNAQGFTLQSTTNVSGSWSNEVVAPVIIGGKATVTNATSAPQKYYRLRN
jgi:large repetitive protein